MKIVVGNFILRITVINVSSAISKAISPKIVVTETDHGIRDMEAEIMVVVEDIPVLKIVVHAEKEVMTEIVTEIIEEEMTDKEDNTDDLLVDRQDDHPEDRPERITEAIEETDIDCISSDDNSNL